MPSRCLCAERGLLGPGEEPCAGFGTRSDELCEQAEREAVEAGDWLVIPEPGKARWKVTLFLSDGGDDHFWRENLNREPDERVREYVEGLIGAGEKITKYGVVSIEVEGA